MSATALRRVRPGRSLFQSYPRRLTTTTAARAQNEDSTPGWSGRKSDEHAVNRSANDPQSKAAKEGQEERAKTGGEKGTGTGTGSAATSRRDEKDSNRRAKEEHPEAPEPVIGMNEERGGKGH